MENNENLVSVCLCVCSNRIINITIVIIAVGDGGLDVM